MVQNLNGRYIQGRSGDLSLGGGGTYTFIFLFVKKNQIIGSKSMTRFLNVSEGCDEPPPLIRPWFYLVPNWAL